MNWVTGIAIVFLIPFAVYALSKIQMHGWLSVLKKQLMEEFNDGKKRSEEKPVCRQGKEQC